MNFLKLYESYQIGFLFGQKYPGVVKAIFRIIKGIFRCVHLEYGWVIWVMGFLHGMEKQPGERLRWLPTVFLYGEVSSGLWFSRQ